MSKHTKPTLQVLMTVRCPWCAEETILTWKRRPPFEQGWDENRPWHTQLTWESRYDDPDLEGYHDHTCVALCWEGCLLPAITDEPHPHRCGLPAQHFAGEAHHCIECDQSWFEPLRRSP